MKRILVEWRRVDGEESGRKVLQAISHTIETMRPFLRTMQTQLDFREVKPAADEPESHGAVAINGKVIEMPGEEGFSEEALIDAILKETARFAGKGCSGNPEDLLR